MRHPHHELLVARRPMTSQRLMGYGLAGLVNLGLVWMLIDGLALHYIKKPPPELKATVIEQPQQQPEMQLPKPTMIKPPEDTIAPPQIIVQQPVPQNTIQQKVAPVAPAAPVQQAVAPTRASGISSTHTTPPYPPDAKRNGQEGTVVLHILISAQGEVTSATVSKSSGVPELDQAAVDWVVKHWKYKPASENGTAVASASDAQVVFNLKNAE